MTFVRHTINKGDIATYNEGIEWASADDMLLLSADDYLRAGWPKPRSKPVGCFREAFGREWAIALANKWAARIMALQGPARRTGLVLLCAAGGGSSLSKVFSVHQNGMAPAFLHHVVGYGVPTARGAGERVPVAVLMGMKWAFVAEVGGADVLPCQARERELDPTALRARHSIVNAVLRRGQLPAARAQGVPEL